MTVKLDRFDVAILAALQQDGTLTRAELAERIGLSQTPCHERIKRLEKRGIIASYHARLDVAKLFSVCTVFVTIVLERHKAADFQRFETAIMTVPEILECHALAGGIDYIVKVIVTDFNRYQQLIDDLLAIEIGISQYYTYMVTKPIKMTQAIPLEHLLAEQEQS